MMNKNQLSYCNSSKMQNTPQRFEYEDDDFDPEAEYEFYDRDTESRLWESDSSYLVAVAPKVKKY